MSRAAERARAALSRGDLIGAYDITVSAIAEGDESGEIRHRQILALARMGDTERAMERFAAYGLDRSDDPHQRAIGARLLKDRALAAEGPARQAALREAFEIYHAIYCDSADSFPGINAATLALLAGDEARARELAGVLLADPGVATAADYYLAATKAEALLLLGRLDEVGAVLASEVVATSTDYGARSGTARQLAMIADHFGLDDTEDLLAGLAPPRVAHFCGHMFAADPSLEGEIKDGIEAVLAAEKIGFAYGALACGADILFAEAALARDIELHAVLPFVEEDFLAQSVLPGGDGWAARYRACLEGAASVVFASEMEYFGDPAQYGYASRMAMGLARLRAQHLGAESLQVAVWDGVAADGDAGTGVDVAAWETRGGRSAIVAPGPIDRGLVRPDPRVRSPYQRSLAAILFTDFAGFSTLKETALPAFWDGVMRVVAGVLDGHGEGVACRNSWGDALYAVTASAPLAAQIALELQDALALFDYATLGLDGTGGMRIGVHYGPAYRTVDHITGRTTFYGTEVSKTARIEPVTPPGAVFVTEPFAAIVALEAGERFACRYVGRIQLAKNYGQFPMYRLTRAAR
ncbi:adenylate/guanylate cyclase domain-containing protein [Sphingosinicella sp. LHD-64]|uniref:adenylate/guanylate cyclase domain-containing protein n=1 Tax=Sphingosinicella sp. LHD-64 TaxID=3072139 RepID=UPI00280CE65B|nr:adenylate/guanylate cyclase domain-containing protein [Sphingosinicella sp. LHD-64]MDQ8754898.1 adenylate/guanylate cyclase domain-containing protein [Sphingosinicella sp. LHD-64]